MQPHRNIAAPPLAALAALAIALLSAPAQALADEVTVQVSQIEASKSADKGIDPQLDKLKGMLAGYPYKSFTLVSRTHKKVASGAAARFPIVGGSELHITPTRSGAEIRVHILVRDGQGRSAVDVTGTIQSGGTQIYGLPPRQDGSCLFLAVTVGGD